MCIIERDGKVVIIDQAKRIAELESQIIQQTGISASRMEERERLQKQIAALQKIAIEKGASVLFNGPWDSGLPEGATYDEIMRAARQTARQQLSEEHPEVDWK